MHITQGFYNSLNHSHSWHQQPSTATTQLEATETREWMPIQYQLGHCLKWILISNVWNVESHPSRYWSGVSLYKLCSTLPLTDSQSASAPQARLVTLPKPDVCKSPSASMPGETNQLVPTSSCSANAGPPRQDRSDGLYRERAQSIQHHFSEEKYRTGLKDGFATRS